MKSFTGPGVKDHSGRCKFEVPTIYTIAQCMPVSIADGRLRFRIKGFEQQDRACRDGR